MRLFPPNSHQHNWFPYVQKKWKLGDVFFIDFWPLGPRFCFMTDPEEISQSITTGRSLPKAPLETDYLNTFLGKQNMPSLEGVHWKRQRSMFNPGFAASHLMTLVPYIVDASIVFFDVMQQKAASGELIELEEYATRLTIDIIGKVVLDSDFDSQKGSHPIVDTFRLRSGLMRNAYAFYPWDDLDLLRPYKLWQNSRKLDGLIGIELDSKIKARANAGGEKPASFRMRKKSVVDLALDGYEKEMAEQGRKSTSVDGFFRQDIIDSMKTFIFAGHDTTASTIAYVIYMLHFYPEKHKKMIDELDRVFGTGDVKKVAEMIKADPHLINQLEYANAVLKETLRLFPPASTMRYIPPSSDPSKIVTVHDKKTGRDFPVNGWTIWPASFIVGRNDDFFPKPAHWIPERFIASQTPFPEAKLFTPAGKDAWRPFEKGPRGCIGQELATIESKVILALCVRDFDFIAEFNGVKSESYTPVEMVDEFKSGEPGNTRHTIEGHTAYQILKAAAKPRDGMPGRLSLRAKSSSTRS